MFVENHPKFGEWKDRLQKLIDAKEAFKSNPASQADVDRALASYNKIADEI